MIKSGAVFIFSVEESGIKRWTEGLAWSQSRISGNFLVRVFTQAWNRSDCSVSSTGKSRIGALVLLTTSRTCQGIPPLGICRSRT